jgi:hypothetical protein
VSTKKYLFLLLFLIGFSCCKPATIVAPEKSRTQMYFCIAADTEHFKCLMRLLGSIHKVNFKELNEIAIFDLGFTPNERKHLNSIQKLKVYDVELTHPDLLKHFLKDYKGLGSLKNKPVRGWYAWKPVVIKQALDRFPYILFLDAGCIVNKPLNQLFAYIQKNNYLLIGDPQRKVGQHCTRSIRNFFRLDEKENQWIKKANAMYSGMQGFTKAMLPFVLEGYKASSNLSLFADDGLAPAGPGYGRHDQTVLEMFTHANHLKLFYAHTTYVLSPQGNKAEFIFSKKLEDDPLIFFHIYNYGYFLKKYIHYKKN